MTNLEFVSWKLEIPSSTRTGVARQTSPAQAGDPKSFFNRTSLERAAIEGNSPVHKKKTNGWVCSQVGQNRRNSV